MLNLELKFDGERWSLEYGGRTISAPHISELREKVRNFLKKQGFSEDRVRVVYRGDYLPEWLKQFQSYYFERIWDLNLK